MGNVRMNRALGQLNSLLDQQGEADGPLLELFLQHQDEAAFESLVLRHGPMVLGVCRRVLRNPHDAEDAFQATFLVLVRKAASIRPRSRVGNWLYGVAYRTALEAKRAIAKRKAKEEKVAGTQIKPEEDKRDQLSILDQELAGLPDHYREVIVLCDLEGGGRKEAAQRLGCPEGTIASRLARARALLAKRLGRHGLKFSGIGLAPCSIPPVLLSSTVKSAGLIASGRVLGSVVSAEIALLIERTLKTMLITKLKSMTAILLLIAVFGAGSGWLYSQRSAAEQPNEKDVVLAQNEDPEQMRKEILQLKARVASLEATLAAMSKGREEVLFQGKPASHWIKALKDRDPRYRKEAIEALGCIAEVDRTMIPYLVEALQDKEVVVNAAFLALESLGKEAVPYLVQTLKTTTQTHRLVILTTLRSIGADADAAVPALTELLAGRDEPERVMAASVLASIGPKAMQAVPSLINLLKEKEGMGRYIAAETLGEIGPEAKAAVPDLIELLKETELTSMKVDTRLKRFFDATYTVTPAKPAAVALGRIGPGAKAALPALNEVFKQLKSKSDQEAVIHAMFKIDPAAFPKE